MRGESAQDMVVTPWEPTRLLRVVDPAEARYSRGFLRCRPERWFPGFAAQWLPLGHSLGLELRCVEAKPMVSGVPAAGTRFVGTIDGEPLLVAADPVSAGSLLDLLVPAAAGAAAEVERNVLLEYMARRLITSLGLAWSGPQSSVVTFETELDPARAQVVAAVRFTFSMNGTPATVWLGLGPVLTDRLDGLWRRQVHSTARQGDSSGEVSVEVAQLAVPPSMLAEYVRPGTMVDLEVRAGDGVTVRDGDRPWLPARLVQIGGGFGCETVGGPAQVAALPDGMTRLSIVLGGARLEAPAMAELMQPGALWETGLPLSDRVTMLVNGERLAEAALCIYEGRFALTVL